MRAIDKIKERLKKYPQLEYQIEDNSISVDSTSSQGFTVWLTENNPGFTVGFDGWHEEFEHEDEAMNCFAFGLSDECRLKVVKYGNKPCSWIVESRDGDQWKEESKTGLIFVPFWKSKSVEYLSNSVFKSSEQRH